jgi:hypothetical protein
MSTALPTSQNLFMSDFIKMKNLKEIKMFQNSQKNIIESSIVKSKQNHNRMYNSNFFFNDNNNFKQNYNNGEVCSSSSAFVRKDENYEN